MEERKITVAEMAVLLDCSVHTIDNWYMWRRKHPEHPLAAMLPDFEKVGNTGPRLWKQSDAWKLDEFRKALPKGRYGILGDVTQKSYRRKQEKVKKIKARNERAKLAMRARRAKEKADEQNRINEQQERDRINERLKLAGATVPGDESES